MRTRFTVKQNGHKYVVFDKARSVVIHPGFRDRHEACDFAAALNVCLL